jgi:hypothetical protein
MDAETEVRPATPTERAVAEMLVTNTGSHFLDSGGAYGRAWQMTRAQYGLDSGLPNSAWDGSPRATEAPGIDDIERVALAMRDGPEGEIDQFGCVYVDTFHWLTERLEYDPKLDAKWQRFTYVHDYGKTRWEKHEEGWPVVVDHFLDLLTKHGCKVGVGIYPGEQAFEPDRENYWINTYNGEDALDRTLLFAHFHVETDVGAAGQGHWRWDREKKESFWIEPVDDPAFLPEGSYVLLQIHGGADVRGGYTEPRLFISPGEQADLFDNDRIEVWCEGTDTLPEGVVDGQIAIEGEDVHPVFWQHRWDNSYGDSLLRWTYKNGDWLDSYGSTTEVLCLPYNDRDREELEDGTVALGYGDNAPRGIANVATRDEETGTWLCPFDHKPLHVSGAIVG